MLGDSLVDDRLVVAALTGDAAAAKALLAKAVEPQKPVAPNGSTSVAEGERVMRALAALAERKPADAIALLEPISFTSSNNDVVSVWAIAQMQAGDSPSAIKGLAFLSSPESSANLSAFPGYVLATLARLQLQQGQNENARKSYQKLFDIWKDADPDLPLLVQAREEFARLGS